MIKMIKRHFALTKTIKTLENDVSDLRRTIAVKDKEYLALLNTKTPQAAIEKILKRGLKFTDYEDMPYVDKLKYYNASRDIMYNQVFKNEIDGIIKDCMEDIAIQAEDMVRVNALRYTINGVQLLKDRIEDLVKPDFNEDSEEENPNAGI